MRKRKIDYKKLLKNLNTVSYFPRYVAFNEKEVKSFESDVEKLTRAKLIISKKDLPFVYGYLYSFDGKYYNNKMDLEKYNEFLIYNYYVLEDNGAYSVDGRYFENVELAKKYNDSLVDYYYKDFGWVSDEVCEYNSGEIMTLKPKK